MARWKGDSIYNPIFVRTYENIPTRFNTGAVIYGKGSYGGIDTSKQEEVFITVKPYNLSGDEQNSIDTLSAEQRTTYATKQELLGVFRSADEAPEGTVFKIRLSKTYLGMSQNQIDNDTEDAFEVAGLEKPYYIGYRRTFYITVQLLETIDPFYSQPILRRRTVDIEDSPQTVLYGDGLEPVAFVKFEYPNGVTKYANVVSGSTVGEEYGTIEDLQQVIEEEQTKRSQIVLWTDLDQEEQDFTDIDIDKIGTDRIDQQKAELFIGSVYGTDLGSIPEAGRPRNGQFVLRYMHINPRNGEEQKRAIYIDKGQIEQIGNTTAAAQLYYVVEWF